MKKLWLIALLILATECSFGQQDYEIAEQYFRNGQFTEAKMYYEKLNKEGFENEIFENYKSTLIQLDLEKEAETLIKRKLKQTKDYTLYVDLGNLYAHFKDDKSATEAYQTALDKTAASRMPILELGQKFLAVNLYAWALKTYEKGKTLGKDGQTYSFEIAGVQGSLGNFQGMCEAYMDILKEQPSYIGQVETSLMQLVDFQDDDERCNDLKALVLKRIQIEPSTTIYSEFLAWFLMQRRDFNGAFIQLNALDKRNNENGNRLMNLAIQAGNNEEYSVANKCYSAVIAKGKSSVFFQQASVKKLQTLSLLLKQNEFATNEEFLALDTEYATIQNEIVLANELAILKKDWAHLKTFFLNNSKDAEVLLKEALDLGGVNGMTIAEIKLELGDVLLFQNKIWEASLLFSQIELDFKDDVLGHEAKFRNAKISFYTGDFEWAQGQLDVLKASTSKLISNNAMQLSLLITDNFNMDTIPLPMMQYARAELLAYQNQFTLSFQTLDSITTAFPGHSLTDEILFTKANIYRKQGDFEKAVLLYTELVNVHFEGVYADDALFALAEIEEKHFKDLAKAQTQYERLLNDFPGSLFVIDARKRYRALKEGVQ